jgi:phosphoadenosine phosphosulfate reductase
VPGSGDGMRDIERRAREAHAKTNSFLRHLDWARREVESAFSHGKAMVSTSWGKDSVALCSIAFGVDASVPMVHLRSPYELPGGEHVIAHFRELGSNLITLDTRKDLAGYIEWLTQYGLGYERESHAKAGRAKKAGELSEWAASNDFAIQVLGMRADESAVRRRVFRSKGTTYRRVDGRWISNPLAWWTAEDVWAYLVSRNLPWHRLYDCETHGMDRVRLRNCGWLTVQGDRTDWRIPWLRHNFPDEYRRLEASFPRVALL